MDSPSVSVAPDEVAVVAAFYRRSAHVMTAAAADLAASDLGNWYTPETGDDAGTRLAHAGRVLAHRLSVQARSAALLAEALTDGLARMHAADREAAHGVADVTTESS